MREKLKQLKKDIGAKRYYALTQEQREILALTFGCIDIGNTDNLDELLEKSREEVW